MITQSEIQHKIDSKTKPLGALGHLESIALQICTVQNTLYPKLENPHLILFAGDHGISESGVSAYPRDVTFQMVNNILNGGAAISVFCKQNDISLITVDAGVNDDFDPHPRLLNQKINQGTKNFLTESAMDDEELNKCFELSSHLVHQIKKNGCNILGFGEMGIGNTSSASMIMHYLTQTPLEDCIGRGTGLNDEQYQKKVQILTVAKQNHGELSDSKEILKTFGGFEIAQMTAAMLEAYHQGMIILIDGFIATSAFLVAYHLEPKCIENALFCHQSHEKGHVLMLEYLKANAILKMDMRLGEGVGCALAYPIIQSAVNFMNEMSDFESAGVSNQ